MIVVMVLIFALIFVVAWWAECEIDVLLLRIDGLERRVRELEGGDTRG